MWPVVVAHRFMRYAKQAASRLLRNLLIWATYKPIRCVRICVCGAGGLQALQKPKHRDQYADRPTPSLARSYSISIWLPSRGYPNTYLGEQGCSSAAGLLPRPFAIWFLLLQTPVGSVSCDLGRKIQQKMEGEGGGEGNKVIGGSG